MSPVSVLTMENEAAVRNHLRTLLAADAGCELVGECSNGAEAARALVATRPDLVYVDARLPGMDGFEMARAIAGRSPLVIFTSDRADDAIRAFEAQAFDYLLKPLEATRFHDSLSRARTEIARAGEVPLPAIPQRPAQPKRIAVRQNGRVIFLTLDQIDWIEAADNYVCLHAGGATHILRETMREMEACLDPARFIRVHRSTIVNFDRVQELQPWFRGEYRVILRDGTQLVLTKTYREKLDAQLLLGRIA